MARNTLTAPSSAQTAISPHSRPLKIASTRKLMVMLAEGRQAAVSQQAFEIYSTALQGYELEDITAAVDKLMRTKRQEGETAFPDLATLEEAILEVGRPRRQAEYQRQKLESALAEAKHRQEHPEEYVSINEIIAAAMAKVKSI